MRKAPRWHTSVQKHGDTLRVKYAKELNEMAGTDVWKPLDP